MASRAMALEEKLATVRRTLALLLRAGVRHARN